MCFLQNIVYVLNTVHNVVNFECMYLFCDTMAKCAMWHYKDAFWVM